MEAQSFRALRESIRDLMATNISFGVRHLAARFIVCGGVFIFGFLFPCALEGILAVALEE